MSQRDRLDRRRDRFFVALGRLGIRWPATVSVLLALLAVAGVYFASQLSISTSRFGLVDSDNWYQRRMFEFFDAFGYPDAPVAIVEGGTAKQRREAVDHLAEALEHEDMFAGRVLSRIDAETLSETLLVHAAGSVGEFRRQLPPDTDFPGALEHGLEGIFGLLEVQLYAALDGKVEVDPASADEQLERLGSLATALEQKLALDAGQREDPVDLDGLLASLEGEGEGGLLPTKDQLRERGLDEEGYFVSNDEQRLMVAVFPEFGGDEVDDYAPAVARLRAIRDQVETDEVSIVLTGLPFLVVDEEAALSEGLVNSTLAAGGGILLLLMVAFRSLKRAAIALMPIAIGTIVSLGALFLLFRTLDPITSSFAAVLMGLAIDFPLHLLARYDEDLRLGHTRRHALFSALCKAGPGVVTGAVTTALAFLTIATTEFTSYGQMGVITAIGLLVALFTAMILLPVMLGRSKLDEPEFPPRTLVFLDALPKIARSSPLVILLTALTLSLVGLTLTPSYNPRYLDFLPPAMESSQGLRTLEDDGAMSPWFAWVTARDLEQARERAEALRAMDEVAQVDSPTDLLPELTEERLAKLRSDFEGLEQQPDFAKLAERPRDPKALAKKVLAVVDALDELSFAAEQSGRDPKAIARARAAFEALHERLDSVPPSSSKATLDEIEQKMATILAPAWRTAREVAKRGHWLPRDLPEMFEVRFVARDGSGRLAIYAYPHADIASGRDDNLAAKRFTEALESVDPEAAGQGVSLYRHNEMIVQGFKRASFFALSLVVVLLLLDFASLEKSLLALFPVLIGMGWMLGVFGVVGLRLNVATIMVMPLVLGIGIDAGVHMMHRWEINSRAHGGRANIAEVLAGTGGAVVLSSLTTMVGFAGLLIGSHRAMVELGATMVIGVGCTLLSSVIVLPALLLVLDKAE